MIVIIITCTEEGQSKIICARHNHWNYSDSFFFLFQFFLGLNYREKVSTVTTLIIIIRPLMQNKIHRFSYIKTRTDKYQLPQHTKSEKMFKKRNRKIRYERNFSRGRT